MTDPASTGTLLPGGEPFETIAVANTPVARDRPTETAGPGLSRLLPSLPGVTAGTVEIEAGAPR